MKEHYIEILKKYRTYLECSKNKFAVFEKMNFDRLESDNGNTWMVASVLSKIIDYALIIEAFDGYELDMIEETTNLHSSGNGYKEAGYIFGACYDLVMDAIDNDCKNPLFMQFKDLVDGSSLYNSLFENMCYCTQKIEDLNTKYEIYALASNVDDLVIQTNERTLALALTELKLIDDPKSILVLLSEIAKKRFNTHLFIENYANYTFDNILVKKPIVTYVDVCNDMLAKVFFKLNSNNFNFDQDIKELNKEYTLFKSYQYDYITNKNKSDNMIQICKS